MQVQTPRRLIAFTRSKCSAGSSAASVGGTWMPALLNAMSSRPKVATARSTMAAAWSSLETSQLTPSARYPEAVSSSVAAPKGLVVDVGQDNGSARFGEGVGGGKPHPGA